TILAECPVCRLRLPWTYLLRPFWSRWRCGRCDSLLRIDGRRRLLALSLSVPTVFAGSFVLTQVGWPDHLAPLMPLTLWVLLFVAVDRPAVVGRCGLRCKGCGYDLRGQVFPRCPECGCDLTA